MKLSLVLAQARSGELKKSNSTAIKDSDIVNYINLGILALYSRFQLKTEEAIIALQDGVTLYPLLSTNPNVTVNGNPIDDDTVLQIVRAYDEQYELPINDSKKASSIFTPSYNVIEVPVTASGAYISVIYRAAPTLIEYVEGEENTTEVPLPMVALEALLEYIAYKALDTIGKGDNAQPNTLAKFELACDKLETYGLVPSDSINMDGKKGGFIL